MSDLMAKNKEPRYLEMANQVAVEMIQNFSAKEQREMLQVIETHISNNYESRISEAQKDLENICSLRDQFSGKIKEVHPLDKVLMDRNLLAGDNDRPN